MIGCDVRFLCAGVSFTLTDYMVCRLRRLSFFSVKMKEWFAPFFSRHRNLCTVVFIFAPSSSHHCSGCLVVAQSKARQWLRSFFKRQPALGHTRHRDRTQDACVHHLSALFLSFFPIFPVVFLAFFLLPVFQVHHILASSRREAHGGHHYRSIVLDTIGRRQQTRLF